MTSRQKYNLKQAIDRLRKDYNDYTITYDVLVDRRTKWDDIMIKVYSNSGSSTISIGVDDLRTIQNVYNVLKSFV